MGESVRRSYFAGPKDSPQRGGMVVTVYLVPVYQGRLVVFDVTAPGAKGRWIPWQVLEFGQVPYESAAQLTDAWLNGAVSSLSLVDIMMLPAAGAGCELAIVFRCDATALPPRTAERDAFAYPDGHLDAIGGFDPVDLERWLLQTPAGADARPPEPVEPPGERLVF